MCNLYSMIRAPEAVRRLFRVSDNRAAAFKPLDGIFPQSMAGLANMQLLWQQRQEIRDLMRRIAERRGRKDLTAAAPPGEHQRTAVMFRGGQCEDFCLLRRPCSSLVRCFLPSTSCPTFS